MARVFGRNTGLWATGLLGIVVIGPLAVFSPVAGATAVAGGSLVAAFLAQFRLSRLRGQCETLSREVDVLSRRLVALEQAPPRAAPPPAQDGVQAEVHELTVEIGLLSGIVRDLSAVVRSQDGEIAQLRTLTQATAPSPPVPPSPQAAPSEPEPPRIAPPRIAPPQPERQLEPAPEAPPPQATAPVVPRPIPPRPAPPAAAPSEAAIVAAFEGGRLDVYLQPVITLPQRKVVAYEALARLRVEDLPLETHEFLPVLERHGRTTELDRRMLTRAGTILRHLAKRGSDARLTYGLSPFSLFEPGFLRDVARMAGDDQTLASLDIALPQASWRGLDSGQFALLSALRGRIGFCLDRPGDLRFDAKDLADHGIGQVKVPADLLLRPAPGAGAISDIALEDLAPALARSRIRLVVTDVATESDVPDLIDLNIPFAQGAAFAPARPVRTEILADLPREDPPPPADDPGPERRPFRSFLRRAS